jgi:hypothetical protein
MRMPPYTHPSSLPLTTATKAKAPVVLGWIRGLVLVFRRALFVL